MAILSVHPWLFFLGKGCHIGRGGKISSKIWYMGVGLQSPNWISPLFPCFFIWRRGSWLIIGDNLFKGPGNFLRDLILLLFLCSELATMTALFFCPYLTWSTHIVSSSHKPRHHTKCGCFHRLSRPQDQLSETYWTNASIGCPFDGFSGYQWFFIFFLKHQLLSKSLNCLFFQLIIFLN